MEQQTIAYQCPNCGAGVEFSAEKQKFACGFCLSTFTEEELLKANTKEAKRERESAEEEYNAHMNEYQCPACGAEVTADEHTAADTCLYCHNPIVLVGRLSGGMRPQRIVPFKLDREAAKAAFLKFAKRKWFVPNDFFSNEQVERITGIYYPFWITDADSESGMQARATRVRVWRSGDTEYTETSNFRIHRKGNIHFEDITTSAFSEADKKMLEGILPYPSDALCEFSMPVLSGFLAKKRNVERESLSEEIRERMQEYSNTLLKNTVHGYHTVSVIGSQMKLLKSHWEYSLLPIWMMTYLGKDGKSYTYAMNGHTGKIYGELPVSLWKLGALLGSVTAIGTVILTFLGGMMA